MTHEKQVVLGKAIGFFFYMLFEHGMGKTKFGSAIGLALALPSAMIKKTNQPADSANSKGKTP